MAGFPIRQYQPGGEFVAVRDMDYGLRSFKAGDPFPWREMGVPEATVQMLWKAVRLEVKRDAVRPAAAAKAPAQGKPGAAKPLQPNPLLQPPRR